MTKKKNKLRDELLNRAYDMDDVDRLDAVRRVYLAGCLAKMQRSGDCSRDFALECTEPIADEHILWADEVLDSLAVLAQRIDEDKTRDARSTPFNRE